jgi:hypothetical protein
VAATADDDNAIDGRIYPLQPGRTSNFDNYSSFVHGINGIMIDISDLGKAPTLAELDQFFDFRVGNASNLEAWTTAPAPIAVSTRPGAGLDGSDRITLIWQDGAIRNQWLEVTVRPGLSGLTTPDVFYFGNAVGDNFDLTPDRRVDFVDRNRVLFAFGPAYTPANPWDVNRDGVVDQTDADLVEQNYTALTGDLNFDDAVTLADLAILQAHLNSPMDGAYQGDCAKRLVAPRAPTQRFQPARAAAVDRVVDKRAAELSVQARPGGTTILRSNRSPKSRSPVVELTRPV